jgi:Uma2 family endonuclease
VANSELTNIGDINRSARIKEAPKGQEDTVMTVTTAKWTLDDYHRMIEVGLLESRHVELLNGEIIEMPPEGPEHAQQSTDTADYLKQLLGTVPSCAMPNRLPYLRAPVNPNPT